MNEENQIVTMGTIKELVPAEIFVVGGIAGIVEKIEAELDREVADTSTVKGRAAIKSNAYKVAQSKTLLDKMGKELADGLNAQLKPINAERKTARDQLDALSKKVRKPLTDWENEQARIKAEELAKAEAERQAAIMELAHAEALLENYEFNTKRDADKIEADRAESERVANEAIKKEQREEEIRKEAVIELEREKEELKAEAAKAERNRLASVEQARKIFAENEKAKVEAAEKAVRDARDAAEKARLAEVKRQEESIQREKDRQEAAARDKAHAAKINRAARDFLISKCELSAKDATKVVKAIVRNQMPAVTIKY